MKWILPILMLPTLALGAVHIVDASGGGTYLTIQAAVDVATTGDVIDIKPGIYYENVVVPYPSTELYFVGDDATTTIVDAGGEGKCFFFSFDGTGMGMVTDLTLRNSGSGSGGGISHAAIALKGDTDGSFLISNCIFQDNPFHCIVSEVRTNIHENLFIDNLSTSIFLSEGSDVVCFGNTFIDCASGIFFANTTAAVQIMNNLFYNLSVRGIWASEGPTLWIMCNNMWSVATPYYLCSAGTHDFALDPQFCGNPPDGNYYLQSDSPCAESQNPICGQVGAFPVECGESAATLIDWGSLKNRY
jgi:hypothetical protein